MPLPTALAAIKAPGPNIGASNAPVPHSAALPNIFPNSPDFAFFSFISLALLDTSSLASLIFL